MIMSDKELELIRDETGSEPDDDTLFGMFDDLGHWLLVALRVLKRRRAAAAGIGEAKNFTLQGVLSVGLSTGDLRSLDAQIARLQAEWDRLQGAGGRAGRVIRTDR